MTKCSLQFVSCVCNEAIIPEESELSGRTDTQNLCWKWRPSLFNPRGSQLGCCLLAHNFCWWKMGSHKFALKDDLSQVSQGCLQNIWAFRSCCSFWMLTTKVMVSKLRRGEGWDVSSFPTGAARELSTNGGRQPRDEIHAASRESSMSSKALQCSVCS